MNYEPAKPNPVATTCQTGTRALGVAIRDAFPELQSLEGAYGCFNRRHIAGTKTWSLHAEGRALDVGVPAHLNTVGWELGCELTGHPAQYGIQRVIWDGHIWSVGKSAPTWIRLKPTSQQHRDHLHIEQYWRGALRPATTSSSYSAALRASR